MKLKSRKGNLDTLIGSVARLHSFQIETLLMCEACWNPVNSPAYDKESLEISLPKIHVQYFHIKGMGGRRKTSEYSKNTAWGLASFGGYADYKAT